MSGSVCFPGSVVCEIVRRCRQAPVIAEFSRIHLSYVPDRYDRESLLPVLPGSPPHLRTEVGRLARYYRREFDYDVMQFEQNDRDPTCTAYLLTSTGSAPAVWAGACCFRSHDYVDAGANIQTLDWVWIHPYLRRKGLLARHWPTFRANHGDFAVKPAVSEAMVQFLRKHNADSRFAAHNQRG
jgi:hypothetical protein